MNSLKVLSYKAGYSLNVSESNEAIDHTFYGFTGVITHAGCWENTRKACKPKASDLQASDCTQLYFVESIRKNFVLTYGTGSYCNGGLHSHFTSRSGLTSVFWTLL